MPRYQLEDWQAESTRLTVFPVPDATTRSPEWWHSVTDAQPDETTVNPKRGSGLVQGVIDSGKLILRLEPDRIDWALVPVDLEKEELAASGRLPTVGPAVETIDAFSVIAEKWLKQPDLPAVARIAFGAVLVHPEVDRRAGYLRLPDYVPVHVDPESTDFLYQINLPTVPSSTGIKGLRLNRLSKWSVVAFKVVSVSLSATSAQTHMASGEYALRTELDINTTPDLACPIPHTRIVDVYRELVVIGRGIAEEGVVTK